MHELAITEHLLSTVLRYGEQAHAERITALNIIVGDLSSVVDDSVQFYWEITAKGTIAETALLHFERIPCKLMCEACDNIFPLATYEGQCPQCAGQRVKVISGNEFQLASIEIEEAEYA
jgi:hydrogenase nickel incorporation protein HypA/HybF